MFRGSNINTNALALDSIDVWTHTGAICKTLDNVVVLILFVPANGACIYTFSSIMPSTIFALPF